MQHMDDGFFIEMLYEKLWMAYWIELFGDVGPLPILHELQSINTTLNPA